MSSGTLEALDRPGKIDRDGWRRIALMGIVIATLLITGGVLLTLAAASHFRLGDGTVFGIGTGLLALTLGMRHAFDADHIAAIDNTTRALIAKGDKPLATGFFFSLGHSTVVFVLSALIGLGVGAVGGALTDDSSPLRLIGGAIGALVSGLFLYIIAILNIVVIVGLVRSIRRARAGEADEVEIERRLQQRGFLTRLVTRFGAKIDASWKLYPLGVLFGLGFDTATEVALLVLSGTAVAGGLPWWAMLSLPLLFAGGMCLFDTVDGVVMYTAYGWAFQRNSRRYFYNVLVTALSIVIALAIGTVQLLALLAEEFGWNGGVWDALLALDLNVIGFGVVGLIIAVWVGAMVIWRVGGFDREATAAPH